MLVLQSAEGDEDHYQNALQLLKTFTPAAPPDPNAHPYITAMTGCRMAYADVIKDEPHLKKIDELLRSCLLQLVAPAIRSAVQIAGNSALLMHLLFKSLGYTEDQHMQREIRSLGSAPAALPATGAFIVEDALYKAMKMYDHRIDKLTNRLHATQDDVQLALVHDAFPEAEQGTPLAGALAEVKSLIKAQLLKADNGRGYKHNMEFFERLIKTYKNKAYPGSLLTAEIKERAGYYAGSNPNPFAKDKSTPRSSLKLLRRPKVKMAVPGAGSRRHLWQCRVRRSFLSRPCPWRASSCVLRTRRLKFLQLRLVLCRCCSVLRSGLLLGA